MSSQTILIVEDEQAVRDALQSQLEAAGYEVMAAASGTEAMHVARDRRPDLMILDLNLIDSDPCDSLGDGFALMQWLRRTLPGPYFPVIIHTANNSPTVATSAQAQGAFAVCIKGDDPRRLLQTVRQALSGLNAQRVA